MPRKNPLNKNCLFCGNEFQTFNYKGKYCTSRCAGKAINKNRWTKEARAKAAEITKQKHIDDPSYRDRISEGVKRSYRLNIHRKTPHEVAVKNGIKSQKHRGRPKPKSILDLSKRTVSKIFLRLGVECSRCGWGEAPCDIHHIHGKNIPDPDNHLNLSYVCPNCHRMAHAGKIPPEELVNLVDFIGDRWKQYYYG